ncbi:MAG TPA: DUF6709 family protein [Candidatus Angelobacter sp.]|jgi:hypothetical protein|nr:DUF6709 family protein [Candidatus Angelobacter sp.]
MASWLEGEARRANRNLLVINGIIVAGGIALAIANFSDINFSRDFWSVLVVSLIFLLGVWNCVKAIRRYGELPTTPVWKHLSVYGNAEQLSMEIEQQRLGPTKKYGSLEVAGSWLVNKSLFSTWVSPVGDLAWVYKKVTKHSVNMIPTGKTYSVIIYGRHKQRVEVSMKEKQVNELMTEFGSRVPWAIYGYSKELESTWAKNSAGFIGTVDSRYQQYKAKSSSASV